ncbi:hypothetical protein [Acidianus sulfidivorans]|uniref:hypothetical protein n=1 Tax=Acidianus sulfidivorans TaxID=312539 RepID=UPI001F0D5C3B|nr:hypothetical protein [Acidianus sulfidivorans]
MRLSDLKSPNREIRQKAWSEVRKMVNLGHFNNLAKNKGFLRSLLWHHLQGVREDAWNNLDIYKFLNIEGIERVLSASSDKIKITAWEKIDDLIKYEIVPKEYIIKQRKNFWRLLRSYYPTIRKKAWKIFPKLVEKEIFGREDVERFTEFLRYKKASIRILAWKTVPLLLNEGFISKENIDSEIKYLEELLIRESNIRKTALKVLREVK